jgi:hypothetical protein
LKITRQNNRRPECPEPQNRIATPQQIATGDQQAGPDFVFRKSVKISSLAGKSDAADISLLTFDWKIYRLN